MYIHVHYIGSLSQGRKEIEMENNPAYVPVEMSQIEDKPTYVNL